MLLLGVYHLGSCRSVSGLVVVRHSFFAAYSAMIDPGMVKLNGK